MKLNNNFTKINNMLNKLQTIITEQKELSEKIKRENGDDIHSVLRTKNHVDMFLELEIMKNLLTELISANLK